MVPRVDLRAVTAARAGAALGRSGKPERARATGDGETLLMWLPPGDKSTAMEVARLLLDHGADPAVRDPQGTTAADRTERNAMFKVAALLRQRE